jgi:branched-chain amino acid transport system ATP-binding protein
VLEVRDLTARFGPVTVVRGIDLDVDRGGVVAVVGANGAGKTTALRSIIGQHRDRAGSVTVDGSGVPFGGGAVAGARAGIAIVPQGRRLFASLTVAEHLDLAASRARRGSMAVDEAMELFPNLARRRKVRAAMLSGGEQQMLAVARAVLLGPAYVLMDEPTEGLAPSMVDSVVGLAARLPARGIGVLVTDQQAAGPLVELSTTRYEMDRGELARIGCSSQPPRPAATPSSALVAP